MITRTRGPGNRTDLTGGTAGLVDHAFHRSVDPDHLVLLVQIALEVNREPIEIGRIGALGRVHAGRSERGRPAWHTQGMRFVDASSFTATRPWGALDIAEIDNATIRLYWTDQPYVWHVNDGPEVFVVLDGAVDMHYREDGQDRVERLTPGRVCCADVGDEHVAHPAPEARILVVERKGSV